MLDEILRAGIYVRKTGNEKPKSDAIDTMVDYVDHANIDILLGPEWLLMPDEKKLFSEKQKDDLLLDICYRTRESDALIMPGSMMWEDDDFCYNAVPVIHQGRIIKMIHKFLDGGTTTEARGRKCSKDKFKGKEECKDPYDRFVDGELPVFDWRGYKCGLEICADSYRLKQYYDKKEECDIDLYFLTSCGKNIIDRSLDCDSSDYNNYINESYIAVRDFGYALVSDGNSLSYFMAGALQRTEDRQEREDIFGDKKLEAVYNVIEPISAHKTRDEKFLNDSLAIFELDMKDVRR